MGVKARIYITIYGESAWRNRATECAEAQPRREIMRPRVGRQWWGDAGEQAVNGGDETGGSQTDNPNTDATIPSGHG